MSRQHFNNRLVFPPRHHTTTDNLPSRFHQSTQNDVSYSQYPSQQQSIESNRETNHNSNRHSTLPLSRITSTATAASSFTSNYHFENPSASSFTRHPPWFDHELDDQRAIVPRTSRSNNHVKRQRRPSITGLASSQTYNHHNYERKRSRNDENEREQQNHRYQSYPNRRYRQAQQTNPTNRNASSYPRSFDYESHNHSAQSRHFHHDSSPGAFNHRQSIPSPRSSNTNHHHHRNGMTFESISYRPSFFHRTSMTTHLPPRPSPPVLLTNLLHRVIGAHAGSYSDNYVHYHHPPTASIDLIAYTWMSPSHGIFSLPTTFNIQFGDYFDLVMPDETPVVGLTDSELDRLPTIIYKKTCTNVKIDDKCAICLSEYTAGEKLKRLRCKHYFHNECINPWLKTSTRCPICRGEQTS